MKKNYYLASDEIDLFNFFKVIWEKKISFIVIVVISIVSGVILGNLNYSKKNSYIVSLKFFKGKQTELIKFASISNKLYTEDVAKTLKLYTFENLASIEGYHIYQKKLMEDFIQEFVDYDEVQQVLANLPYIKKKN